MTDSQPANPSPAHGPGLSSRARREMPEDASFERILSLPLAQLFVAGRSGSFCIHAYLDGHPDVLQIPHHLPFFDVLSLFEEVSEVSPRAFIREFVAYVRHADLFDTSEYMITEGRLGRDGRERFIIDRELFCDVFCRLLRARVLTPRTALYAVISAYVWCLGGSIDTPRIVFHHIHHGEWLLPATALNRYNLPVPPRGNGVTVVRPDYLIATVRDPFINAIKYVDFARAVFPGQPVEQLRYYDTLLELAVQDFQRLQLLDRRAEPRPYVIRLEDLKADSAKTIRELAQLIGIDERDEALQQMTLYGAEWLGDKYSTPSPELRPDTVDRAEAWQINAFLECGLGDLITVHGYRRRFGSRARALCALVAACVWPSVQPEEHARWNAAAQLRGLRRALRRLRFALWNLFVLRPRRDLQA